MKTFKLIKFVGQMTFDPPLKMTVVADAGQSFPFDALGYLSFRRCGEAK